MVHWCVDIDRRNGTSCTWSCIGCSSVLAMLGVGECGDINWRALIIAADNIGTVPDIAARLAELCGLG